VAKKYSRQLPAEPKQTIAKKLEVHAAVPLDAFYKTWHIYSRPPITAIMCLI
jgi:hypothetical protein